MADHSEIDTAISNGAYLMICGPTAAGKSALALALAERGNGVIINADSMQLYADLRVLTARPDEKDEARAPHRLYGVLDGASRASVASWLAMAGREAAAARAAGQLPILIGGTGLYFQAALQGLAPVPDVPADIHAACVAEYAERGGRLFREALLELDPVLGAQLNAGDSQRLVRAMGVVRATGRPLSGWQSDPHEGAIAGRPVRVAVIPPREELYENINIRFALMMDGGAGSEVTALAARRLDPSLPVMKAIGVREIMALQAGEIDQARAVELASRESRRYAKRQMTWIRNNFHAEMTLDKKFSERNLQEIFAILSKTG